MSQRRWRGTNLFMRKISLAASVIAMNPASLGDDIRALEVEGVDLFHLDIMDGHFVPNMTFGPATVKALRPLTDKEFDVHLMVTDPAQWIAAFADAGADVLSFHAEAVTDIVAVATMIREHGIKAGLAVNPATKLDTIDDTVFTHIDRLLIMTVNPGFGGQAFIDQSDKIAYAASLQSRFPHMDIMVDGGINLETAPHVIENGAQLLVSGSALMNAASRPAFMAAIKGETA